MNTNYAALSIHAHTKKLSKKIDVPYAYLELSANETRIIVTSIIEDRVTYQIVECDKDSTTESVEQELRRLFDRESECQLVEQLLELEDNQ